MVFGIATNFVATFYPRRDKTNGSNLKSEGHRHPCVVVVLLHEPGLHLREELLDGRVFGSLQEVSDRHGVHLPDGRVPVRKPENKRSQNFAGVLKGLGERDNS